MPPSIRKNLVLGTLLGVHAMASAAVLNFDDLPSGAQFFTADYQGFSFGTNNLATTAWFHTDESSPFYAAVSGSIYIATDVNVHNGGLLEPTQAIRSAVDFVFDGAFFTGFDTVSYELYLDGTLVHSSAQSAPLSNRPLFVASGYAGLIDAVVVRGSQGFFALDDFTYNSHLSVPEPGTLALALLGGLAGATVARRRAQPKVDTRPTRS
jgi:hypothetical protein